MEVQQIKIMKKIIILLSFLIIGIVFASVSAIIIPSPYTYTIFQNSTAVYAVNGKTGNIDYWNTDPAIVIQSAGLANYPNFGSIFITCGTYNLKSMPQTYGSSSIQGCGEGQTILKRAFNGTYLHTISMNPSYNGLNGYAVLKDITIDGNYGHVDNLQDEVSIAGNGYEENVEVKNFNAIGQQLCGNILLNNPKIIGVNSSTSGSTMGIWSCPNSRVSIIGQGDFENMRVPAILASGDLEISTGSYFSHNHIQSAGTGGGQIAVGKSAIITGIVITNGGGSATSGIELNNGTYNISNVQITGEKACAIVSNGQQSIIQVSNSNLKGNTQAICQNGLSMWYLSNNIP